MALKTAVAAGSILDRTLRAVDAAGIVAELERLLLSQTDLAVERGNIQRFKEAFVDCDDIHIPAVFAAVSSEEILVMEYVEGVPPYEYGRLGIDPLKLAEKVDDLQDTMIFIKGLCHADLHPGNFFWTTDGQLTLIDFGLVHDIPLEQRNHLLTFYVSVLDGYYEFATQYFLKHFLNATPNADLPKAEETVAAIVRKHWVDSEGKPQFAGIFQEILTVLSSCGLSLRTDYSPLFLTLITLEGYLYSLDPAFDMLDNYRKKRLREAEYAAIPVEAEKLILGENGTYSTALFADTADVPAAYEARNRFIEDRLRLSPGDRFIDVGCGRGWLLERLAQRGVKGIGVTMSRAEYEVCQDKGLECVWSSWEETDGQMTDLAQADAMAAVEMIFHLASLHENREGLLDQRLQRFFGWADRRLRPGGVFFLQTLNIKGEFLEDPQHKPLLDKVCGSLPWMGFSTVEQIRRSSESRFQVEEIVDASADLLPTYRFWRQNINAHQDRLRELIKPKVFGFLRRELDMVVELAEKGLLQCHRIVLRKPSAS